MIMFVTVFITGCSQPPALTRPCIVYTKSVSICDTNMCVYTFFNLGSYYVIFRTPKLIADFDLTDVGDTIQIINGKLIVTKRKTSETMSTL